MKLTLTTLLLFVTVTFKLLAQSPEKLSYQAIIRAQDNSLVVNSRISLKVIIHQGSTTGTTVFQETQTLSTNSNGLVTAEIGTGTLVSGDFSKIAWQSGPYFIETQVDPKGGTSYEIVGISQLLSVPYALHAKTAEKLVGGVSKASIISFSSSRNIASGDINNVIECTTSATLNLTSAFDSMVVGDSINLEAHNGAVLTVQAASGVSINYTQGGSAKFTSSTGNVRFGFLRKIGTNSYIISGQ